MRTTMPGICAATAISIFAIQARAISVSPLNGGTEGSGIANAPAILVGDANNDGIVDVSDYVILKRNIGLGPAATTSQGDCDGDGYINGTDLKLMATNFGKTSQSVAIPPVAVPEPLTMGLFTLGLVAVGAKLRGRTRRTAS